MKDFAHDFPHAERIFKLAKEIATRVEVRTDNTMLVYGAFFHGFDKKHKQKIIKFLSLNKLSKQDVSKVLQTTSEVHNNTNPLSTEGKILHDAHLLEGGLYSIVLKSLVTGFDRKWSLIKTVRYIENKIGSFECNYAYTRNLYHEREEFAKKFTSQMRAFLRG